MFKAIADGFGYLFGLLADLGLWLLDGVLSIFKPVLDLISAIFLLIYYLCLILIKVLHIVFTICKLLIGLIAGLIKTITGLNYTGQGTTIIPDTYTDAFGHISNTLDVLQIDKVVYVISFALWVFTAMAAIRIIGSMRGGASE